MQKYCHAFCGSPAYQRFMSTLKPTSIKRWSALGRKKKKKKMVFAFFPCGEHRRQKPFFIICTHSVVVVWCPADPPTTTPPQWVPASPIGRGDVVIYYFFLALSCFEVEQKKTINAYFFFFPTLLH